MIIRVSGSIASNPVNLVVGGTGSPGSSGITVNVPQFVSRANTADSASYATVAAFAYTTLGVQESASYSAIASQSYGVIGGDPNKLAVWSPVGSLTSSLIEQSDNIILINSASIVRNYTNPNALEVYSSASFNIASFYGDHDEYTQINVKNLGSGPTASTDIVATANFGSETVGYINMGINSDLYAVTDNVGQAGEAYLFAADANLLIGTTGVDKKIVLFVGGGDAESNARVSINPTGTVGINTSDLTAGSPEALRVKALNNTTYNLIIGEGDVDNYLQFNIKNTSGGGNASSDIVATADNGTESSNYIDMGINNSGFNSNLVGEANDAYLYSTGRDLHIGNTNSSSSVQIFAGGLDVTTNTKLQINPNNQHNLYGSLLVSSGSISSSVTGTALFDYSDFTTQVPNWKEGRVYYNATDHALSYYNDISDVSIQLGQESVIRARNTTGTTILNGTPVRISGVQGNRPKIVPAQSTVTPVNDHANWIIGVATHDILDNSDGYATTFGIVHDINLSAFTEGDTLYVSTGSGQLTNVKPTSPYNIIEVGIVTVANNNGQLFVNVRQPIHLHDISQIKLTNVQDKDLLTFDTGSLSWINSKSNLILSGTFSGSGQNLYGIQTSVSSSWASSSISSSFAQSAYTTWINISGTPSGLVSSSVQAVSWSVATASYALNGGTGGSSNFASSSLSSSWASSSISSSFAQDAYTKWVNISGTPSGLISSSAQASTWTVASASLAPTSWSLIVNRPIGIVSSSVQINTGSFSGSFVGTASYASASISSSFAQDAYVQWINVANKPSGIISSSTQASTWTVATASLATSASYSITSSYALQSLVSNWNTITGIPTGLVSSSVQINTGSFSGSFVGTASYASTSISSSFAQDAYTKWINISGTPSGLVSSSAQASTWTVASASISSTSWSLISAVPSGLVSSSVQASTWTVASASLAPTSWSLIVNRPSGLISSSIQINTGSFSGSFIGTASYASAALSSSFAQDAYVQWINVANKPSGLISSSAQASTWTVATASLATSASYSITSSYAFQATSASWAPGVGGSTSWGSIVGVPVGLVSSSVQINTGSFSGSFVGTASYASAALSSSFAQDAYTKWVNISGTPSGLVSSSVQASTWTVASASLAPTSWSLISNIPVGLVSSSAQAVSWSVATSSYALQSVSASWAPGVGGSTLWGSIVGIPTGLVSSSVQINTGSFSGSFVGTASYASAALSSSFAQDAYVQWVNISGTPSGLVSSSTQASTWTVASASIAPTSWSLISNIPSALVSSSTQINTGSFNGSFIGTSSYASASLSSSFAQDAYVQWINVANKPTGLVSSSVQASTWTVASASIAPTSWSLISAVPGGLVSSSTQINTGSFSGSFIGTASYASAALSSSFAQDAYVQWINVANKPSGLISSSAQASTWTVATASLATSASYSITSSYAFQATSASWAPGVGGSTSWGSITGIPAGLVSSSVQINTGSFSGSFDGNHSGSFFGTASWANNVVSSSFAATASAANSITFTPQTSSYAVNADLLDGLNSTVFATTGSNTFIGRQNISSSLAISTTGSIQTSGSLQLKSGNPTLDLGFSGGTLLFDMSTALLQFRVNSNTNSAINLDGGVIYPSTNLGANLGTTGNRWSQAWVNSIFSSGSSVFTGSITISGSGFTGSLFGTATSASIAPTSWSLISNIPSALVSSSTQINTGSFNGSFIGTSSYASASLSSSFAQDAYTKWTNISTIPSGLVSSSAQASTWTVASASLAPTSWSLISNIPSALVSSSTQASTWTVATSSVATSASYAISASWAPGAAVASTLTVQDEGSLITATPISLNFIGAGVSVVNNSNTASITIPGGAGTELTGSVTGTFKGIATGSFTGSVIGSLQGTSSFAVSSSWAPTPTFTRSTSTLTTSVLSQNAYQTGTITLSKGYILYRIITSVPSRVRVYNTTIARDSDVNRGTNVEPTGSHGLIVDVLTTSNSLTASMAPIPYGVVLDEPLTTNVPYTITNNQTGSTGINVSFTFLPLE